MKSLKKSLNILLSTAAALILLVACSINSSIKKPETTVSIAAFPENVQSVWINGEENAATYTAGVNEAVVENIQGKCLLFVNYSKLSDSDKNLYLGYGNLKSDSAPFKVFVNGKELKNEIGYESANSGEARTNAQIDCFHAEFEAGETVTITFENKPRKLPNSEVHLLDETRYFYIDVSGIDEHLNYYLCEATNGVTDSSINYVTYNGLRYVPREENKKIWIEYSAKENYKISIPFNLEIDNVPVYPENTNDGIDIPIPSIDGYIVVISGGDTEPV